ncbi:class I mannose-6-phosphate isomerase [Dellaglioa algida]|uniref:class I mannose-6-phosphate isomerase n=1 Tax=Dellaglioa algida TaxID=105612 RepID=UPI0024C4E5F6|nr:class I mannose-6-phosphate isomerase [Dellaglioa algida]MDK1728458.1 class I mannose-6-phosphate isomerase [Dellaglioa algida]MDK1736138.1 class I mannose-6-phosphate isomerase [Dellaglioa algida]MDK1737823.1 class I mannose-6-phosphate isomerase [Dellaglioa algida]
MTYNLAPTTIINKYQTALAGYSKIVEFLQDQIKMKNKQKLTVVIECYPATDLKELKENLIDPLKPQNIFMADDYAMKPDKINNKIIDVITDDRVLGVMSHYQVQDFYPDIKAISKEIKNLNGLTIVYGTGATIITPKMDILIYADLARWEIQLRYRSGLSNWQQDNASEDVLRKFKRGYFFEWRIADRLKKRVLPESDFILDTNIKNDPKLITSKDFFSGLKKLTTQPYRTVPYFDASVWGGTWMRKHFDLPDNGKNYGWAFDGVPEENSLYFKYGDVRIEVPAINLMLFYPEQILGTRVFSRFGSEFPIRFDYLDTMGGGNLSLQVHPLTEYINDKYGMSFTQDESYYILDATDNSSVYLGLKENIDRKHLYTDLTAAREGKKEFPDSEYVNRFPAKKHDHFLIPAGTIHCGGADTVVLEISATPYIFTFKMWDWGRVGLDGKPRPLHIDEGMDNLQDQRDTVWVQDHLINKFSDISNDSHEIVEKTGLHPELEFIQTNRHWINDFGTFKTYGSVNMLNMVEGETGVVESVDNSFNSYEIHFGETFIVPADIENYRIRNLTPDSGSIVILQAFVK